MSRAAGASGDAQWHPQWIRPQWPVADNVRSLVTTRAGGVSQGPWGGPGGAGGLNLGEGSDDPVAVAANRARLRAVLPAEPCWLRQVHGTAVVDAAVTPAGVIADAAFATVPGVVCCVLVADCLPVLLADAHGRGVAAAHAGWRGLAAGVIQATVAALRSALGDPAAPLQAYLGPAIGPAHFEVGPEVLDAMRQRVPGASQAFVPHTPGKFRADLYALARLSLAQVDVTQVHGGGLSTLGDPDRLYSFRRGSPTGRQAALIWRNA